MTAIRRATPGYSDQSRKSGSIATGQGTRRETDPRELGYFPFRSAHLELTLHVGQRTIKDREELVDLLPRYGEGGRQHQLGQNPHEDPSLMEELTQSHAEGAVLRPGLLRV